MSFAATRLNVAFGHKRCGMLVRVLEVGLVAVIGLALLAPLLRAVVRKLWPTPGYADRAGMSDLAEKRGESRRRWAGWIGGILFVIAIINGLAYSVHTSFLGGSAYSGERVAGGNSVSGGQEYTAGNGPAPVRAEGRYYVSSHGRYTRVTEQQWRAVRMHELALYITHALGFLVGFPLLTYSQGCRARQKPAETGAAAGGGA
jgi:hypothetical protein